MRAPIFRHPDLDFCNLHIYGSGAIDDPRNTIAPAVAMAREVRMCLSELRDGRPFFDSEHGPIHAFKDRKRTLPEVFDNEYFRHMSWAHLASGGAGGGMRWPNRRPHILTPGMRETQHAMARFLPLIDWSRFRRRNLNDETKAPGFHVCACADEHQAVLWLIRRGNRDGDGRVRRDTVRAATVALPGVSDGAYIITGWDTSEGRPAETLQAQAQDGLLRFTTVPIAADRAFAVRRAEPANRYGLPRQAV
jgi:mannan endo-1,4-beta-mannosidase